MIYSNNAECGEIFSLQSLFSTVQVEKFCIFAGCNSEVARSGSQAEKLAVKSASLLLQMTAQRSRD